MIPTVVCFKWEPRPGYRSKYGPEQVLTLQRMIARHYSKPFDFVCCTDDARGLERIHTIPLWNDWADLPNPHGLHNPSCYRRLKVFAPNAGEWLGERIIAIDLDMVVTGDLSPLFDDPAEFKIWGQSDFPSRQWYNGSFWSLKAGSRPQVWTEFSETSPSLTKHSGARGSDQGWFSYILGPHEQTWSTKDGIYSYRVHIAKQFGNTLPSNCRLVAFHGKDDPWCYRCQQVPWIQEHYR